MLTYGTETWALIAENLWSGKGGAYDDEMNVECNCMIESKVRICTVFWVLYSECS